MKRSVIIITVSSLLALSGAAIAQEPRTAVELPVVEYSTLLGRETAITQIEQDAKLASAKAEADALTTVRKNKLAAVYEQQKVSNRAELEAMVTAVLDRVGKTRYVFSGSTPLGWDCSGLVTWAYGEMGVELPHSAAKQAKLGTEVEKPQVGDIIVFGNSSGYFHSSIYVGDGLVVHAGFRAGRSTEVLPLDHPSLSTYKSTIRRYLDID
jgi:cell wall-associated NlpC family hydrolase